MAETRKRLSEYDAPQITQKIYNSESGTISVDGFLAGKVGRKINQALATTAIANDTEVFTFSEDGVTLFVLTMVYTSGTRQLMISAERTA